MGELMFDKMEIDTQLAEEFLEANKSELDLLIDESIENKVQSLHSVTKLNPKIFIGNLDDQLKALAKKIEENAELFAQLEALKRKVSKDDIKSNDIKLLVQNLKYMSNYQWYRNHENYGMNSYAQDYIVMGELTPLASLGIAAQYLKECSRFTVQYCDATAAICYLFARLCHAIGLNDGAKFVYKKHLKESVNWKGGCTGVITEHSDMDSAVDAILSSTSSPVDYKWKLQRLYVQESVYDRFMKALSWKCNVKQSSDQACVDISSPQSSEVLIYDQNVFLFDYAGTLDQIREKGHVILVEAYRTTKELLSLLKKDVPFCVSLWSNDISESNEIAYNLNVNIVWINDYGVFDGPVKVSQALYYLRKPYVNLKDSNDAKKVLKMAEGWSKMSFNDRVEKMKQALDSSMSLLDGSQATNLLEIKPAMKSLENCEANKTVKYEKGKMWVFIDEPNGVVCQTLTDDKHFIKILTSVAYGNVFMWNKNDTNPCTLRILEEWEKQNLPFICDENLIELCDKTDNSNPGLKIHTSIYQTRVVYSNYGTIFAN